MLSSMILVDPKILARETDERRDTLSREWGQPAVAGQAHRWLPHLGGRAGAGKAGARRRLRSRHA